jgi:hypothetical protein
MNRHHWNTTPRFIPKSLVPLWRHWRIFILTWAMQEIHPSHEDVPEIVRELHFWKEAA